MYTLLHQTPNDSKNKQANQQKRLRRRKDLIKQPHMDIRLGIGWRKRKALAMSTTTKSLT